MKRKFKLADGTVGMLDTDTGDFTPGESAAAEASGETKFPLPGYENVPPEPGLKREDPIGDMIVGNAVAGGLPRLLEAAGAGLSRAGANATTRLATRATEEEAARLAVREGATATPASPIRRAADAVGHMIDLHHPARPLANAAANMAEGPVDRLLASSPVARTASRMTSMSRVPGLQPGAYLMYLLGHGLGEEDTQPPEVEK